MPVHLPPVAPVDTTKHADVFDDGELLLRAHKAPAVNVIVTGRPKAGSTLISNALATKLGLHLVSLHPITARLLAHVARAPPVFEEEPEEEQPPPAEGEEAPPPKEKKLPPPFDPYEGLNAHEVAIVKAVEAKKRPPRDAVLALLKADISCPRAQYVGYALDAGAGSDCDIAELISSAAPPSLMLKLHLSEEESQFRFDGKHNPPPPAPPPAPAPPPPELDADGNPIPPAEDAAPPAAEEEEEEEEPAAPEVDPDAPPAPVTALNEPALDWMKLMAEVEDVRLLPDETAAEFSSRLSTFAHFVDSVVKPVASKLLHPRVAEVDASQRPQDVVNVAMHLWQLDGPLPLRRAPVPIPLPEDTDDSNFESQRAQLMASGEDGSNNDLLGPRLLTHWGRFDPVAYAQNGKLLLGKGSQAAAHMHRVFLFATPENRAVFCLNPSPFLALRPGISRARAAVISFETCPPAPDVSSGLSTYASRRVMACEVAAAAAERLQSQYSECKFVSAVHAAGKGWVQGSAAWEKEMRSAGASDAAPAASSLAAAVAASFGLPDDVVMPPAPPAVPEGEAPPEPPPKVIGPGADVQFVMRDFPRSAEHVAELAKRDLLPAFCVIIEPGMDDEEEPVEEEPPPPEPELDAEGNPLPPPPPKPKPALDLSVPPTAIGKTLWPFGAVTRLKQAERDALAAALSDAGCVVIRCPLMASQEETLARAVYRADPLSELASKFEGEGPAGSLTYGWTRDFCPVVLRRHGRLIPGKKAIAFLYRGKLYQCAGEEEAAAFEAAPGYYAQPPTTATAAALVPPPPYVMVTGPPGSGKTTVSAQIASSYGMKHINVQDVIRDAEALIPKPVPEIKRDEEGNELPPEEPAPEDPEVVAKRCVGHVMAAVQNHKDKSGVVLEGAPWTDQELPVFLAAGLLPEVLFVLTLSDDDAVSRLFKSPPAPAPKPLEAGEEPPPPLTAEEKAAAQAERDEAAKADIAARNAAVTGQVAALRDAVAETGAKTVEIYGSATVRRIMTSVHARLRPHTVSRSSLLSHAAPITTAQAVSLLSAGTKSLSKFGLQGIFACIKNNGYRCSITRRASPDLPLDVATPSFAHLSNMFPVVFGPFIYFTGSKEKRAEFVADPLAFVTQVVAASRAPIRAAVMGPPLSGKTTCARSVATACNIPLLDAHNVVAWVAAPSIRLPEVENAGKKKKKKPVNRGLVASPSALSEKLAAVMSSNAQPDDELVAACVARVSLRVEGFVLDGVPRNPVQAGCLVKHGVQLQLAVSLQLSMTQIAARYSSINTRVRSQARSAAAAAAAAAAASAQAAYNQSLEDAPAPPEPELDENGQPKAVDPPPPSEQALALDAAKAALSSAEAAAAAGDTDEDKRSDIAQIAQLQKGIDDFVSQEGALLQVLAAERDIEMRVDASASTFAVTHEVVAHSRQLSYCKEANLNSKERGQLAAPLRGMQAWLPRTLMQSVSSRFSPYCPISWVKHQELVIVDGSTAHFAVEAGGVHYQLSDQTSVDAFLADPQPTIDGPELPVARPRQLKPDEADSVPKTAFAYEGYCPVTLKDGPAPGAPAHTAVQRGQKPWVVEYKSTMYVCRDAASTSRFMRKPENFLGLKLPDNLPVRVEDLDMSTLPLTQYLDVTVVQVLSQGLVALGAIKPLFPYSSREDSAKVSEPSDSRHSP
jgi:adenylate kinase family enzyme